MEVMATVTDRIQALTMDDKNVEFAGCSRTDLLGVFFWLLGSHK